MLENRERQKIADILTVNSMYHSQINCPLPTADDNGCDETTVKRGQGDGQSLMLKSMLLVRLASVFEIFKFCTLVPLCRCLRALG